MRLGLWGSKKPAGPLDVNDEHGAADIPTPPDSMSSRSECAPSPLHANDGEEHEGHEADIADGLSLRTQVLLRDYFDWNDELDEYGFRRRYDAVSLEDQVSFTVLNKPIAQRREARWDAWLKEKNLAANTELPERCAKMKRYIRKGVPSKYRARCWFKYSGAQALLKDREGFYTMLTYRERQDYQHGYTKSYNRVLYFVKVIDTDIYRTFPDNIHFKMSSNLDEDKVECPHRSNESNPYLASLRRILVAFAYYSWPHPDPARQPLYSCSYKIGYCQSLNFIVGMLLLVFAQSPEIPDFKSLNDEERLLLEEKIFWVLVSIVEKRLPPNMYGDGLEGVREEQDMLWSLILANDDDSFRKKKWSSLINPDLMPAYRMKAFSRLLPNNDRKDGVPPLSAVTTNWFLTLFINHLPFHTVLRVWDSFLYEGESVLIKVAYTLLKLQEPDILSFQDSIDAFRFAKELPKRVIDAHSFLEFTFKQGASGVVLPEMEAEEGSSPVLSSVSSSSSSLFLEGIKTDGIFGIELERVGSINEDMVANYRVKVFESAKRSHLSHQHQTTSPLSLNALSLS